MCEKKTQKKNIVINYKEFLVGDRSGGAVVGGAASGCGMLPVQVWGVSSYVGPRQ